MKIKIIIPAVSIVLGAIWVFYGLVNHGFWHPVRGPIAGFVPILIAVTLVVIGTIGLIQSFKEQEEPDRLENWTIVLAAASVFVITFLFGMLVSLMAFVFGWLKIYEKASWKQTISIMAIAFSIVFGAFVLWLRVPFPRGIIIETIFG